MRKGSKVAILILLAHLALGLPQNLKHGDLFYGQAASSIPDHEFFNVETWVQKLWPWKSFDISGSGSSKLNAIYKRGAISPEDYQNIEIIAPLVGNCSGVGVQKNITTLSNACASRNCTATRMSCQGALVDISTFGGDSTGCQVLRASCSSATNTSAPAKEVIFAKDYKSTNCTIHKLLCPGLNATFYEVPPSNIPNGALKNCSIQVICDSGFSTYGYEKFDYHCYDQDVVCGNVTYNSTEALSLDPDTLKNCTVHNKPCSYDQEQCSRVELDCLNTNYQQCNGTLFDVVMDTCDENQNQPNCTFDKFLCPQNVTSDYLQQCYVDKLKCGSQNVSLNATGTNCRISEMRCTINGTITTITVGGYNGNETDLYNCSVSKLSCVPPSPCTADHRRIVRVSCPRNCSIQSLQLNCSSICNKTTINETCICPIDRNGAACERHYPLTCSLNMVYPAPLCYGASADDLSSQLSIDPACYIYPDQQAQVQLGYRVLCSFPANKPDPTPEQLNTTFPGTYYINVANFSVFKPMNWTMNFRIWNFNRLADKGGVLSRRLDKLQMVGLKLVWFNFTFGDYSRYIFGNRLYGEAGFSEDEAPPGNDGAVLDRKFLDLPISTTNDDGSSLAGWQIALIVFSVIGFIGVIGFLVYVVFFYRGKPVPVRSASYTASKVQ